MEESLTISEVLIVLAIAAVGFVGFGYWLRGSVLVQMARKTKTKRLSRYEVSHWVGRRYPRK